MNIEQSNIVYYILFQDYKLKFAISSSISTINQLKVELIRRIKQKGYLKQGEDILLMDDQKYELLQSDKIKDVLAGKQKKVVVSRIINSEIVQKKIQIQKSGLVNIEKQIQKQKEQKKQIMIPKQKNDIDIQKLNQLNKPILLFENIIKQVKIIQQQSNLIPNQDQFLFKFKCIQYSTSTIQIITSKYQTFYQLSLKICSKFHFHTAQKVKALIYKQNGTPLILGIDSMSFNIPALNQQQIYEIVFSSVKSTSDQIIMDINNNQGNDVIFVKYDGKNQMFKINLKKDTVYNLKRLIYDKLRIHPNNQLLKFGIKTLEGASIYLHMYQVIQNSIITLSIKLNNTVCSSNYNQKIYSQNINLLAKQTQSSLRCFRSNLYIIGAHLSQKIKIKLIAFLRQYTNNNSFIHALYHFFKIQNIVYQTQKIALQQGFYTLFLNYLRKIPNIQKNIQSSEIFKYTRQIMGFILNHVTKLPDNLKYQDQQFYEECTQNCQINNGRIKNAVYVRFQNKRLIMDKDYIKNIIRQKGQVEGYGKVNDENIVEDKGLRQIYELIRLNSMLIESEICICVWRETNLMEQIKKYMKIIQIKEPLKQYQYTLAQLFPKLKIFNPLQLKSLYQFKLIFKINNSQKIYLGTAPCNDKNPHIIYDVISGSQKQVNLNLIAGSSNSQNLDIQSQIIIKPIVTKTPKQAIAILLDVSGSMNQQFFKQKDLTKIGAVKSFFQAFSYRTMAYNMEHVISLILFNHQIIVKCDFTQSFMDFNKLLAKSKPFGSTKLYDAIFKAIQTLTTFEKRYPGTILRIITLTDGIDNNSQKTTLQITQALIQKQIKMDSFVVGFNSQQLKCITFGAGGRCFLLQNIQDYLKIFEQQTILSCRSRKNEQSKKQRKPKTIQQLLAKMKNVPYSTQKNIYQFNIPEIRQPVIQKSQIDQVSIHPQKITQIASTAGLKRIFKQLTLYQQNPHPFINIFPCVQISLWKILLLGPKDTPYEDGLFLLYANFPSQYPYKPPQVRFITPIYHCNVNKQGRICHSVFDRNYTPIVTIKTIMESIYGIILSPQPEQPLDNVVASYFLTNIVEYRKKAQEYTILHAKNSVQQYARQIFDIKRKCNLLVQKTKQLQQWIMKAKTFN